MSKPLGENDPARWMLDDEFTTTPTAYDPSCYICKDHEFAQMGLPLCTYCPVCSDLNEDGLKHGHVPADDTVCTACGTDTYPPEYGPAPDGVPTITDLPDIGQYDAREVHVVSLADVVAIVGEQVRQDREAGL